MEFTDLSRYISISKETILPFKELREMKPVVLTNDLKLVEDEENLTYVKSLAEKGIAVVKIRRKPADEKYLYREDFPRRILFEMTSRCNYRCKMCPQNDLKRPRMDMEGSEYRRILDEINEYGVEGIWLYHLGESLLHPEFIENVEHIKTKNNLGNIWLSTNGQFFTEEKRKAILNSNITWINYSAHSVTEETYLKVIPEGDFKSVQENLEAFYDMKKDMILPSKPFLHCQMIEQECTVGEIDEFILKHYKRAEIVSVNMLEYVNMPNNAYGIKQRERSPLKNCVRVARNDCFICSNGDVTLCDAAYNGELYLGNVHEDSLYDIWNGEKRKEILKLNKEGRMQEIEFCRTCTDYDI